MARPFIPADRNQVQAARLAMVKLREARDLLKDARCPLAVDKVRLAIASTGGAIRHVEARSRAR
jgi:hypothetical protein